MRAHLLALRHGANDLVVEVLRMRRSEPDPFNAVHFVHKVQKVGEVDVLVQVVAVCVHVLSEEHDFFVSLSSQLTHFGDDPFGRAAPLLSPHVRHDAIGAKLVAAVDDGDIRLELALTLYRQAFYYVALFVPHLDHAFTRHLYLVQQLGQPVDI